jgi:DnaJ-class molecular chaperone
MPKMSDGDRFFQPQPSSNQTNKVSMTKVPFCNHCEGKGYIEIRDCSGEIQREETCLFCSGTGSLNEREDED